jgi:hypothetical protein
MPGAFGKLHFPGMSNVFSLAAPSYKQCSRAWARQTVAVCRRSGVRRNETALRAVREAREFQAAAGNEVRRRTARSCSPTHWQLIKTIIRYPFRRTTTPASRLLPRASAAGPQPAPASRLQGLALGPHHCRLAHHAHRIPELRPRRTAYRLERTRTPQAQLLTLPSLPPAITTPSLPALPRRLKRQLGVLIQQAAVVWACGSGLALRQAGRKQQVSPARLAAGIQAHHLGA